MTAAALHSHLPGPTVWLMAARPRTLTLSVMPVAVGCALAWAEAGHINWPAALTALLGALLIQLATNLHNDAADFERGADGPGRVGPVRATAMGLLTAAQCKRAAMVCFGLAATAGLYLIELGGWPILVLGLLSIASGWAYTGGPRPIAYTPLGEAFVIAFFGIGAVVGTDWLQIGRVSGAALIGGLAMGLFAAAVLLTNNHRDRVSDARAGRRTLAMVIGQSGTSRLYGAFVLAPFALLPVIDALLPQGHTWPAFMALPVALAAAHSFGSTVGAGFNRVLARTAMVQMIFGLLLCLGLML